MIENPEDMLTPCNKYIVALLLLVYTSQSFAALLMPCPMDSSMETDAVMPTAEFMHHVIGHATQGSAHDHAMMRYFTAYDGVIIDAVTTAAPPANDHDNFDCCDAMGDCLMGSCMIHGVSNDFIQASDDPASIAAYSDHLKGPSHLTFVHFRPPIFA